MKKLIFSLFTSMAIITSIHANKFKEDMHYLRNEVIPEMKPALAYVATTGLLHGIGKAFYSYSGAQRYTYNMNAIYNSDLNIFDFPQKQLTNKCEQIGRKVLTLSSILHAPLRSFVGTLTLLQPGGCLLYFTGHPAEDSFKK